MYRLSTTYVLWGKLGIEDVRCDDVANGVSSVEGRVVDGFLGLSGAVCSHPRDEQRVDSKDKGNQIVADKKCTLVFFGLGKSDQKSDTNNDNSDQAKQEWKLALEAVCEPRSKQNRDELKDTKRHVEQNSLIGCETGQAL